MQKPFIAQEENGLKKAQRSLLRQSVRVLVSNAIERIYIYNCIYIMLKTRILLHHDKRGKYVKLLLS